MTDRDIHPDHRPPPTGGLADWPAAVALAVILILVLACVGAGTVLYLILVVVG